MLKVNKDKNQLLVF